MRYYILLMAIIGISLISGCTTTENGDLYINKDYNTFNSYFANGISCSGFKGSNLTGISGSVNRMIGFNNFPLVVVVDTYYLNQGHDYVVNPNNSVFYMTFKNPIWNDQDIGVCLATSNTTITNSVYLGSVLSGSDGDINRVLNSNITNPLLISADNQLLNAQIDYTNNFNNITFKNKIYNDMVISVWG